MSDSESDGWSLPSIRRMLLVAVLLFVLALVAGVAFGVFGTPSVERVENRFGGVNETATEIETNLTVSNPNPVGARFGGIRVNYTVSMNDRLMARGTKAGVELPTGNSTIMLTTVLANERIPDWWVSHLRNGERTDVRVQANVQSSTVGQSVSVTPVDREIETDILASVASDEPRPVNTEAPVGNPVLVIEESDAAWGTISEAESTIAMTFVVRNPNTYPVAITRIGYDTSMNDVAVGEGEMESGVLIPQARPGPSRRPRSSRTSTLTSGG